MPKVILSVAQQLSKLSDLQKQAKAGLESSDVIRQLGGLTVYACLTDFYTIQAARLIEQILLKNQVRNGAAPTFEPHEDSYFYDNRIDTRKIVKGIEQLLPLSYPDKEADDDLEGINKVAREYMKRTKNFLNHRNEIVHRLCSPKTMPENIPELIRKTEQTFLDMMTSHAGFFKLAGPFRFGPKEMDSFYGTGKYSTDTKTAF
ncbi:hypothetical protein HYW18_03475 [Candidatus Uhrbacteria bacterium]|nr:hypothetical protein [Candidatus Uhrbacteria bacterium]